MTTQNVSTSEITAKWNLLSAFTWQTYPAKWKVKEFDLTLAQIGEGVGVFDKKEMNFVKNILESLAVETGGRKLNLQSNIIEAVVIQDKVSKTLVKNVYETFGIIDSKKFELVKNIQEALGVGSSKSDPSIQERSLYESIAIAENVSKHLTKNIYETLGVAGYVILPFAEGIISDIGILNTVFSESDIAALTAAVRPIGFGEWKRFVEGEYTHKEALFRLRVINEAPENVKGVEVTEHKIICDVYDVIESGESNVSGEVQRVYFTKKFHAVPVVTLTVVNSAVFAIPERVTVTKEYFDVTLKTADGYTTGRIAFQAHGY